MKKVMIISIIFLFVGLIANSGCIDNKVNSTWGEKKISMDAIKVANNTTAIRNEENSSRYYVTGYLENNNPYDALDIKIKITTYYSNGTIFAVNYTPYIKQKNIPANGNSYFYALFYDPNKEIARYEVKILEVESEYLT
jgi:hypothetical protein